MGTSVAMSLFHLLNAMRFSNSFVIFLIFSLVAEGSSTQPDVQNQGKNCWYHCREKSGPCESFCGTDGLCCRRGNNWIEKGCTGQIGAYNYHTCTGGCRTERNQLCTSVCGGSGKDWCWLTVYEHGAIGTSNFAKWGYCSC